MRCVGLVWFEGAFLRNMRQADLCGMMPLKSAVSPKCRMLRSEQMSVLVHMSWILGCSTRRNESNRLGKALQEKISKYHSSTLSKASCKRTVLKGGASLHRFIELEKLIGEGWELSVFKDGERLHISIPVDSGFASKSYHFKISQHDFSVLRGNRYRRMALEYLLHEMLQPRLTRGDVGATDKECNAMIAIVVHGSATAIERAIGTSRNTGRVRRRLEQAGFPAHKGA